MYSTCSSLLTRIHTHIRIKKPKTKLQFCKQYFPTFGILLPNEVNSFASGWHPL